AQDRLRPAVARAVPQRAAAGIVGAPLTVPTSPSTTTSPALEDGRKPAGDLSTMRGVGEGVVVRRVPPGARVAAGVTCVLALVLDAAPAPPYPPPARTA